MANIVEIVVKAKDEASAALKQHEGSIANLKTAFTGLGGAVAGSGLLAIGAPLGAAGAALGAFGALAKPELDKVTSALGKTGTAGQKAWAALTPQEQKLGGAVKSVESAFSSLQNKMAPVIDKVVTMGAGLAKDFIPSLGKLATAGGKIASAFIGPLDTLVKSKVFSQFINQVSALAVEAGNVLAPILVQLLGVFMQLFEAVGPAGIQILKALGPLIIGLINYITPAIVSISKLVATIINWLSQTKLLKPVLLALIPVIALIVGVSGIGGIILAITAVLIAVAFFQKNWKQMWADVKNWAQDAWNFLTHGWGQFLVPGLTLIRLTIQLVRNNWRDAWNDIRGAVSTAWNAVKNFLDSLANRIRSVFSGAIGWLNSAGRNIIDGLWNGLKSVWASVSSWFGRIRGWIGGAFGNPGKWLWNAGYDVIKGFLNGLKAVWKDVTSFIHSIAGWIKAHKGPISLDSTLLHPAGEAIMDGFLGGLKHKYKGVTGFISGVASHIAGFFGGGGVGQWKGLVDKALGMLGLSKDLDANVLYQMQTESSGNPNAINLTDINAQRGDPSRGLMQVIMSTFRRFHVPGTSNNIYDPLANIAAAIKYAWATYGPNLANQYGGIGSGHGYAAGGPTGGGWSVVGEMGRELVKLPPGAQVYPHANANAMMGSGTTLVQLEISGGQSNFDQFMMKWLKENVRIKGGGSVQVAFGKG